MYVCMYVNSLCVLFLAVDIGLGALSSFAYFIHSLYCQCSRHRRMGSRALLKVALGALEPLNHLLETCAVEISARNAGKSQNLGGLKY